MTITLLDNDTIKNSAIKTNKPPYSLQQFQLEFGDYLRSQRQSDTDSIPNRVGRVYQDLVFNNVCNFLNQCFPICRAILGDDDFKKLSLYFFERYPLHSPYFSEIPMQFVDFLSQLDLSNFDKTNHWHNELTLQKNDIDFVPDYLSELAHYEWLELYVDTLPSDNHFAILNDNLTNVPYCVNTTIQNNHYNYPVHTISVDNCDDIIADEVFLVVLRDFNNEIKFVHINALTHLLIDFIKNSKQVYLSKADLIVQFAKHIDYHNADELLKYADELFELLLNEQILIKV